MTGVCLFVGLLAAGALLGSPAVWWLRGWWDRSPAQRECDALADRDLAAGR